MLQPGTALGDRFAVEVLLGHGAMGHVYRALDGRTGARVALKVMSSEDPAESQSARFAAEIEALAQLAHPAIVAYVAHGADDAGTPWLALELLDGETLEARLARGPLSVGETMTLAERVAGALEAAHRRGVVHRDLKPGNLFLRGGAVEGATVLDFGIARHGVRALTRTGVVVGTPEYMAPEQARGDRGVGPSADVFALGCVLWECLTGAPAFGSGTVVAVLSRILFEHPTPLARMRPGVPADLADLIARMLSKSAADRPRDGAAVRAALAALGPAESHAGADDGPPRPSFGDGELERVSVLVASAPSSADDATATVAVTDGLGLVRFEEIARALRARGSDVEVQRLADGSVVATVGGLGASAVDQAMEAAACARIVRERWPEAAVAVATATRIAGSRAPLGDTLERAVALLPNAAGGVVLDAVTAGLLGGRVRTVEVRAGVRSLADDTPSVDETRTVLGRATPFVGREQEVSTLDLALTAAFEERSPRAVLVTGAPGLGKSRLRHELRKRCAARTREDGAALPCLEGRGEPLRAGSPYAVLAQAVRALAGASPGEGPDAVRARLRTCVAAYVPTVDAKEVTEGLGVLCGLPAEDDESVRLRAARQDPRLMQARVGEAFLAMLRAVADGGGVLVVVEDAHWADRPSLDLLDLALRTLDDCPLCVVAFARPELREALPDLWKGRVLELPLGPLGRRACERFAARVAGDRLAPDAIARAVAQCAGNALFLEELLRFSCEGGDGEAPDTVLAILQGRVAQLESGACSARRASSASASRPAGSARCSARYRSARCRAGSRRSPRRSSSPMAETARTASATPSCARPRTGCSPTTTAARGTASPPSGSRTATTTRPRWPSTSPSPATTPRPSSGSSRRRSGPSSATTTRAPSAWSSAPEAAAERVPTRERSRAWPPSRRSWPGAGTPPARAPSPPSPSAFRAACGGTARCA